MKIGALALAEVPRLPWLNPTWVLPSRTAPGSSSFWLIRAGSGWENRMPLRSVTTT